ncbi:MAG: multiheme c-type cytochrome [Planctomycetia bacterium]|nr:multiheme c-type cytochrome [Planctomycetia bacterium]
MDKSKYLFMFVFVGGVLLTAGLVYRVFETQDAGGATVVEEGSDQPAALPVSQELLALDVPHPFEGGAQTVSSFKPNLYGEVLGESNVLGESDIFGTPTPEVVPSVSSGAVGNDTGKNAEEYRPSRANIDPTKPFDPIKENGDIFVGWEKPLVTLVLTGRLNGYMEPCGCAGLERMMGGLSRRAVFLEQLHQKGWNPLTLDVGGISPGYTVQAQLKFLSAVNMLREMNYDAITFGNIDLNFPAGDILAEVSTPGKNGRLFTSANVGIFAFDPQTLSRAKMHERNNYRIGVIGVLGDEEQKKVQNDEIVFEPAIQTLEKYLPVVRKKCDVVILLSHATEEESRALAAKFPQVDIIVSAGGPPVSPSNVETIPETGQYFVTIGEKGMHAIVLGLYDDDKTPIRYQRVPMDSRFASSPKILDLMALYQEQLKTLGLEGLGIRPIRNPYEEQNGRFVGSARCESCHEESYLVWQKSRHAKSWKTLEEATPPRTFDPECIACHVVGWSPQHMIPLESGFLDMKSTPHLSKVGCESCHGPGEKHIQAEMGTNLALQEKYRTAVRLTLEDAKSTFCVQCHDLDNSPNFNFDTYWPCIEHPESDE